MALPDGPKLNLRVVIFRLFPLHADDCRIACIGHVIISVDKSTQQMSVSVDGCRATASQCQLAGRGTGRQTAPTIRSVWRPRGFRSCITIRPCLIRSFSTVDMPSMAAMRSIGLADLPRTAAFACTLRTPQLSSNW